MELIADTSFLVSLWRGESWAQSFAESSASRSLALPWVVQGEFWDGAFRAGLDPGKVQIFLSIGIPLNDVVSVVPFYTCVCVSLQDSTIYRSMSQNDLWIAAVAIAFAKPLVTKYLRHFGEIKELRVEAPQDL